jgi:hypothetical protein
VFGHVVSPFLNGCGAQAQQIYGGALAGGVYGAARGVSGVPVEQRPRLKTQEARPKP